MNLEKKILKPILIGNIELKTPIILAPMAGVTDLPFRNIVKKFGNFLTCSEMISSEAIFRRNKKTIHMIPSSINGIKYVQIFGANPESMYEAAKFNEDYGADMLDINMGCPVKKVTNTYAGSALMKDEKLAKNIIHAVRSATHLPVTLKIRLGWDHDHKNCATIAKIAEDEGINMITVHGRTRSDLYSGNADWDMIRNVKNAVKIPVICNGDIVSIESAEAALEKSSADGIMIGRGALGKPWFLRELYNHFKSQNDTDLDEFLPIPTSEEEKLKIILEHLKSTIKHYGETIGASNFKKHGAWYIKNGKNSSAIRTEINQAKNSNDIKRAIEKFFSCI